MKKKNNYNKEIIKYVIGGSLVPIIYVFFFRKKKEPEQKEPKQKKPKQKEPEQKEPKTYKSFLNEKVKIYAMDKICEVNKVNFDKNVLDILSALGYREKKGKELSELKKADYQWDPIENVYIIKIDVIMNLFLDLFTKTCDEEGESHWLSYLLFECLFRNFVDYFDLSSQGDKNQDKQFSFCYKKIKEIKQELMALNKKNASNQYKDTIKNKEAEFFNYRKETRDLESNVQNQLGQDRTWQESDHFIIKTKINIMYFLWEENKKKASLLKATENIFMSLINLKKQNTGVKSNSDWKERSVQTYQKLKLSRQSTAPYEFV